MSVDDNLESNKELINQALEISKDVQKALILPGAPSNDELKKLVSKLAKSNELLIRALMDYTRQQ